MEVYKLGAYVIALANVDWARQAKNTRKNMEAPACAIDVEEAHRERSDDGLHRYIFYLFFISFFKGTYV